MAFRLGNLQLCSNLFLSPLAGYTNLPFRQIIRGIGGVGLCTTDLVNARSLLEKNPKALQLIESSPDDHPLAVQLYGSVPEEMRDAAALLESKGVDSVDVNMGCPVRKICRSGGGSAMMGDHTKAVKLAGAMVGGVKIPVTCKMRLGWDDENITAPDLARALEDVGVSAITIHGRTRQQGFSGGVDLAGITAVVRAVQRIPVVGNGDITTPEAAAMMFRRTGCAAVSIGRGAFYNPWIFRHTAHYLATGAVLPEPGLEERLAVMSRHLDRMVEVFGDEIGCRKFRKVATEYSKRFGPAVEFNRGVVRLCRREEFASIVDGYRNWRRQFLGDDLQLRAEYAPRSLHPSYVLENTPTPDADSIRVPKGPNELW